MSCPDPRQVCVPLIAPGFGTDYRNRSQVQKHSFQSHDQQRAFLQANATILMDLDMQSAIQQNNICLTPSEGYNLSLARR